MIPLFTLFLLFAGAVPSSLEQVKADPNPEHRAKAAIDYAAVAEKNAEAAYAKGDVETVSAELKNVEESIEMAQEAFTASRKTPGRNPGPFKYAEMRSREILIRLGDLEQKMDAGERTTISRVKEKVQDLHDVWFEGIMGRKK
jgi:hypothetical protein